MIVSHVFSDSKESCLTACFCWTASGPFIRRQRVQVPIKFLSPDLIKDMLNSGQRFELWDMRVFAEGTIVSISP